MSLVALLAAEAWRSATGPLLRYPSAPCSRSRSSAITALPSPTAGVLRARRPVDRASGDGAFVVEAVRAGSPPSGPVPAWRPSRLRRTRRSARRSRVLSGLAADRRFRSASGAACRGPGNAPRRRTLRRGGRGSRSSSPALGRGARRPPAGHRLAARRRPSHPFNDSLGGIDARRCDAAMAGAPGSASRRSHLHAGVRHTIVARAVLGWSRSRALLPAPHLPATAADRDRALNGSSRAPRPANSTRLGLPSGRPRTAAWLGLALASRDRAAVAGGRVACLLARLHHGSRIAAGLKLPTARWRTSTTHPARTFVPRRARRH